MERRRYCDPVVLNGQIEYLPDILRNKIGLPSPQMLGIYEDYAKNIPGFQPLDRESVSLFMPKTVIYIDYYFNFTILLKIKKLYSIRRFKLTK